MLWIVGTALAVDCGDDLNDAEARLRANKPLAATLGAFELLESGACPDQAGRAHLVMGRGLMDLDLVHSAQHHFVQVVVDPPSPRSREVALVRLVQIAEATGDDTQLMRLVDVIDERDWPEPARDRLHYVAGLKAWEAGELSEARRHFSRVDPKSEVGSEALYSQAVALTQVGRLKTAATQLVQVGRLGEHPDYAAMGMGRVYYGIDRFDMATTWYERVPVDSALFAEARFENAWTQFMLNQPNRTLGELLTLKSPHFSQSVFQPEADLLEAITWYSLCDWERAHESLDRLETRVRPVHEELLSTIKPFASPQGRKRAGQAYSDWFVDDRDTDLDASVFLRILDDRPLLGSLDHLDVVHEERDRIAAQKRLWRDSVGVALLQRLDEDQQVLERKAGLHLLRRMAEVDAVLRDLLTQGDIARYEVLRAEREGLEDLAGGATAPLALADPDYAVEADRIMWPFNGEFWEDELGSYVYTEQGQCR